MFANTDKTCFADTALVILIVAISKIEIAILSIFTYKNFPNLPRTLLLQ